MFYILFTDSVLSAEAPEFVPRLGSIQTTAAVHHRNQQPTNAIGHSIYRNSNHGSAQNYPVTHILLVRLLCQISCCCLML